MLQSYSPSILLRTLRSRALCQASTTRFSTTTQRAEEVLSETTQSTPGSQAQLPYFIHRSGTNNLPVYEEAKRGGSLKQTRIRKIDGDLTVLREDVAKVLNIGSERVNINGLARHIIIKGWHKSKIVEWLEGLRF